MQLFTAQLDEWQLNLLDITDSMGMAIAKHEFVNTDGAYIQHMGNRPREISFRTYWFGTGLDVGVSRKPTYQNHFDFLNVISDSTIDHIFVHPKYGTLYGYVESFTTIHDDTQDYVVIDIRFTQKDIQTIGFVPADTILTIDNMAIQALDNALSKCGDDIAKLGHSSLIGKTIDFSQSIASQVNNVSQSLRTFCNDLDRNINAFDSFLADIVAPVTAIEQSVAFLSDIPSRLIQSVNNACNRLVTSLSNISNLPVQSINNITLGLDNLYDTITGSNANFFQVQFRSVSSIAVLSQAGSLLQTDEDSRNKSLIRESKPAFDINGYRVNVVKFQNFMSTNDLINMMSLTRKFTQKALILDRGNQDIKNMSSALVQFINDIKLKRLTVKTITVNNIPIHALLQQLGLPYEASDRILALNPGISNPNFITGPTKVYSK